MARANIPPPPTECPMTFDQIIEPNLLLPLPSLQPPLGSEPPSFLEQRLIPMHSPYIRNDNRPGFDSISLIHVVREGAVRKRDRCRRYPSVVLISVNHERDHTNSKHLMTSFVTPMQYSSFPKSSNVGGPDFSGSVPRTESISACKR